MKILHNGKAIIVGTEVVNIDNLPNLEVIGCNMTGTDHLPWKKIEERGIKVISLQGETKFLNSITSTAEHTIGLMIALLRNYNRAFNSLKAREKYKGNILRGKTLGLIGFGRVGRQVYKMARALGMKVVAYDTKSRMDKLFEAIAGSSYLHEVLAQSDVVSIHIPLDGNEGFFDDRMFEKMKPTACLINTSRSKIVDTKSLLWALKNGIIKAAAVDFTDDSELVKYIKFSQNLILTNHLGGCTFEDMELTENFIIKKVNEYLKRKTHNV